jgi:hypothetical protein
VAGPSLGAPDVGVLISLALARLEAGAPLTPALDVAPLYLREPDARINWVERPAVPARHG